MGPTICFLLGVGLTVGAVAESPENNATSNEAQELLQKAASAVKKTKLVRYRAEFTASGWVASFVPTVKGTAMLGEQSEWGLDRFRCEVSLTPHGSSETLELTAGSDGDLFFLVDPKKKMAHEDLDSAVLGTHGRAIQRLLLREFSSPEPFKDELASEHVELIGTETVGGEECYHILVKAEKPPDLAWFISKKDYLPRRVRRTYPNREDPKGEKGTTELTLSDLVVNPKLEGDPFKLDVPPGYTKTDDFAP